MARGQQDYLAWVNSAALKAANITKDSADPQGGWGMPIVNFPAMRDGLGLDSVKILPVSAPATDDARRRGGRGRSSESATLQYR